MYKLTKGSVSIIRKDAKGVEEAEKAGFVLMGSCDENYDIIDPDARPELPLAEIPELPAPKKAAPKKAKA